MIENVTHNQLRKVTGIQPIDLQNIKTYLANCVNSWIKTNPNSWFSLRDFAGGQHYNWQGTPLYVLYLKYVNKKNDDPVKDAGHDAGWILKTVLFEMKGVLFETKIENRIRQYKLIP